MVRESTHGSESSSLAYPEAPRGGHVDVYHGVEVPDLYRPLEQEDTPELDAWFDRQAELTAEHGPRPADVDWALERLRSYELEGWNDAPKKYGDKVFFERYQRDNNFPILMERLADGTEREVMNANTWSEDDSVTLKDYLASPNRWEKQYFISPNGSFIAYAKSPNDSDEQEWHIIDTTTFAELSNSKLPRTSNAKAKWREDETGFFYECANERWERSVYFHKIAAPADEPDERVFEPAEGDTTWYTVTVDGNERLYISGASGSDGSISVDVMDLSAAEPNLTRIAEPEPDTRTSPLGRLEGGDDLLLTEKDSPRRRIVRHKPGEGFVDVVPEAVDAALIDAELVADRIVATYYDGVRQYIKIFGPDESGYRLEREILPQERLDHEFGVVSAQSTGPRDNPEIVIEFEGPLESPEVVSYNVLTDEMTLIKPRPEGLIDTSGFEVSMQHVASQDETQVPMLVYRPKDLPQGAPSPTILEGYGGFGLGQRSTFNRFIFPWLESGGSYAIAYPRGDEGATGKDWHQAAKKLGKHKTFEDVLACVEELTASGVTSSDLLAVKGASNGALLPGYMLTQHPEKIGAALMFGGVLDMLRFDKVGEEVGGPGQYWQGEYGKTDVLEEFENLLGYSPVHNVAADNLPAVLAGVGGKEDRVPKWHTLKFIAALQAAQRGERPILLDLKAQSAHSLSSKERYYEWIARDFAFLWRVFGMSPAD